uniref:Uncharacterized protein n=1 Tax=Oryza glumipatula TaxID=40148 RepID=A0A0E0B6T0_9ORYZ
MEKVNSELVLQNCYIMEQNQRLKKAAELLHKERQRLLSELKAQLLSNQHRQPPANGHGHGDDDKPAAGGEPIQAQPSRLDWPEEAMGDEARKAVENALGWKKTGLPKLGMRIERRQQRLPPSAGGGGWSGGGGWFRWFSSGGFWDAAKQTLLTIVGIIAAFFLIANFNVLVAAIVSSLLAVLRQIRRALSFVAQCILQGVQSSAPRRSSPSLDTGNQAAVVVKDRVGKSAKERVVRKWGNGV